MAELEKLRFQVTSVHQKRDYRMSASVQHMSDKYTLNTIFKKTIGGVLSSPLFNLCKKESCTYTLEIELHNVKIINIESFLINKIETLSIQHFEEYYDRVYQNDKITYYNLPYDDSMEELDITIGLIPVTGTSGLYVNAKTLPLDLESFDWKEKGPLAKRITIKWEELVQMRAEKTNLFIAVSTSKPGEFLIKIDAHDQGYKGRLNAGIIESGFVGYEEMNMYLYYFEVFETQNITFDLKLNIISGDGNLYIKPCNLLSDCNFDSLENKNQEKDDETDNKKIEKNQSKSSNIFQNEGSQNTLVNSG